MSVCLVRTAPSERNQSITNSSGRDGERSTFPLALSPCCDVASPLRSRKLHK